MRPNGRTATNGAAGMRAVIDIGSNTVRLVVYGGPPRAPIVLHNEKVTAKLGKGLAETGLMPAKGMASALSGLKRYALLLRLKGVACVEVVATAAVRDAANGPAFLDEVRALGLKPRLLSGEEEALGGANGVMAAFPGASGIVADLGGGSLELTGIGGGQAEHGISLPLGTLRLPALRKAGGARFAREVRAMLSGAHWQAGEGVPLYLVGGSYRALARIAMRETKWPLDDPHGFTLDTPMAEKLCSRLARAPRDAKSDIGDGVSAMRLAALPDAAALLAVLAREVKPSRIVFSGWGLREGLLFSQLDAAAQAQDPVLAGVSAWCEGLGSSTSFAAMVAGWTASANPADGEGAERLRLAATMLALASHRVEPNLRTEEAVDWALRKRWIGLDPQGRAMIAAAILANAGRGELPAAIARLVSQTCLREATTWGLATRLCRRFSVGAADALANSSLAVDDGRLVLSVRESLSALCTESAHKDLRVLAERMGLEPAFAIT